MKFLEDRENKYWFKSKERSTFQIKGPLTKEKIIEISKFKREPEWLLEFRLKGLALFEKIPFPDFGPDLSGLDLIDMVFYSKPTEKSQVWEEIPKDIRETFKKLGVSEEMKKLSGTGLQYDSEVIFERTQKMLRDKGVIYCSMDQAIHTHPEIVQKYLGKIVSSNDNKFSALNSAIWSGGTFIYVPKNVKVSFPLHTYFRINVEGFGQFERTLIIVEEGGEVTYVEGCTAPTYLKSTLHAAVVEVIAEKNAKIKYVTLQNWSKNVYNLGTKRAYAKENAFVQWIDGNFGSKVTMKYPAVYLLGDKSRGEVISIATVSSNQNIDSGARIIHKGKDTSSNIISKTISNKKAISTFRSTVRILPSSEKAKSIVQCDSLLMGDSTSESIPKFQIDNDSSSVNHEAKVSHIDNEKLFYLVSRGIDENAAKSMLAFGFVREFIKEIPLEYALELQRLIELNIGGQQND